VPQTPIGKEVLEAYGVAFLLVGQSVPNWAIRYCGDFVFSCNNFPAIRSEGFLFEISWNFLEFRFSPSDFLQNLQILLLRPSLTPSY